MGISWLCQLYYFDTFVLPTMKKYQKLYFWVPGQTWSNHEVAGFSMNLQYETVLWAKRFRKEWEGVHN